MVVMEVPFTSIISLNLFVSTYSQEALHLQVSFRISTFQAQSIYSPSLLSMLHLPRGARICANRISNSWRPSLLPEIHIIFTQTAALMSIYKVAKCYGPKLMTPAPTRSYQQTHPLRLTGQTIRLLMLKNNYISRILI